VPKTSPKAMAVFAFQFTGLLITKAEKDEVKSTCPVYFKTLFIFALATIRQKVSRHVAGNGNARHHLVK
jgi:hypothetical protein